jgi:hypothetical protein
MTWRLATKAQASFFDFLSRHSSRAFVRECQDWSGWHAKLRAFVGRSFVLSEE